MQWRTTLLRTVFENRQQSALPCSVLPALELDGLAAGPADISFTAKASTQQDQVPTTLVNRNLYRNKTRCQPLW